jgi:TolB-like protein
LRVAGAYIIGAWVLLQVADLGFQSLELPDRALRFVWIAALVGFPLAMVFGWRYDITPDGIVRTPPAAADDAVDLTLKGPDYAILTALSAIAVIIGYGVVGGIREVSNSSPFETRAGERSTNSIAVLPLQNLSGDADQEYLAAGMHDALLTSLSKISSLRVISRTSSERVDRTLTVPEIGKRLNVTHVVEGSVTREEDRIRIIVQLIDTATDTHLWGESYERSFDSILSLQGEMARALAQAIQVKVSPEEIRTLSDERPVRPDTYEAYLKGMFQMHKETSRGYRRGIEILTQAVEDDPTSGLAYAGLAYGYAKLGHSPLPEEGAYPRARAAAERALQFDPDLPEAHLAVGMYKLYFEWDWAGAEAALRKAIDLNPSLVTAHYHYAWLLELLGERERALEAGEQTIVLDPLSPFYAGWLADQYRVAGMGEQAIAQAESTLQLRPNYPVAWMVLGLAYAEMGRPEEAIRAHENLGDGAFWSWARVASYVTAGRLEEARALAQTVQPKPSHAIPLVLLNASLGDREQMFRWLEVAREIRAPWYPWLVAWFPQLHPYRDDPRLQALAEALRLEFVSAF